MRKRSRLLIILIVCLIFVNVSAQLQDSFSDFPVCVTSLGEDLCLNGGGCSFLDGQVFCNCLPKFFGFRCEKRKCPVINPCYNNALCEKTFHSFVCHCQIGFGGRFCEKKLSTACDLNPCGNGTCTLINSISEYKCDCLYGYTGENCANPHYCLNNKCVHGDCIESENGAVNEEYTCRCASGWRGKFCDKDVDECATNPCQNNGKCHNSPGYYSCECPPQYYGKHCEWKLAEAESLCPTNFCENEGKCKNDIVMSNFGHSISQCVDCAPGYYGARCEERVEACALRDLSCLNGGICVSDAGGVKNVSVAKLALDMGLTASKLGAKCKCPPGLKSDRCEIDINECETEGVCLNGGTCLNEFGSFRCFCMDGFNGTRCENNIDDCADNICYTGSTCVDGILRYDCICTQDRIGPLCENENPCFGDRNKCAHGECFADVFTGDYTCSCEKGFKGFDCSEDINECEEDNNVCRNGKCTNTFGSFNCEYAPNCSLGLCQNGAFCLDYSNDYECLCEPGYSGRHCENFSVKDLYNCHLICHNGGVCRKTGNFRSEYCECPNEYGGHLCELRKPNPCEYYNCHGNSTCFPTEDYLSYTCQCPPQMSGKHCDIRLKPCIEFNPCQHGVCQIDSEHNLKCECDNGFSGVFCDVEVFSQTTCAAAPCQNDGKCIPRKNGFECVCESEFEGDLCQYNKTVIGLSFLHLNHFDCRKNACHNNGSCAINHYANGIVNYQCECHAGFTGNFCELDVNECLPEPCLNKGLCINLINAFRCDCASGFTGEHCEIDVNECDKITCLNGGKCIDEVNTFFCECSFNFMGRYCEVDIQQYDRTDALERELCERHECARKAYNGKCDLECNYYACDFDAGDCALEVGNPFNKCETHKSYCAHVFADGKCDEICNDESCLFDAFDCQTSKPPALPSPTDASTKDFLKGELSLILLVDKFELFANIHKFLRELSSYLRASIHVAKDTMGQTKIYEWQSNSPDVAERRLSLPDGFDTKALSVIFNEKEKLKTSNVLNDVKVYDYITVKKTGEVLKGIKIFFQIQVEMCRNSLQTNFSCFSEMESVAAYLGAASAKKVMKDVSFKIHTAEAIVYKRPTISSLSNDVFPTVLASAFVILLCVMVVAHTVTRKRKLIAAPVFKPPTLAQNKCANSMLSVDYLNTFGNDYSAKGCNAYTKQWCQPLLNSLMPNFSSPCSNGSGSTRYSNLSLAVSNAPNNCCIDGFAMNSELNNVPTFIPSRNCVQQHQNNLNISNIEHLQAYENENTSMHYIQAFNNMSYGSSSGVSSEENSPFGITTCSEIEQQKHFMTLHNQALTKEGILEPVDSVLVNVKDARGQTPLMALFSGSRYDERTIVQLKTSIDRLVVAGANVNAQDNEGRTALILAIKVGQSEVVGHLIAHKADVNLADFEDQAPIHHAIESLVPDCLIRLLTCVDLQIDALTQRAETPLILCAKMVCCTEAVRLAELLIDAGADLEGPSAKDGATKTALHVAASVDNVEMIRLLVSKGANKEAIDIDKKTPLSIAAMNCHLRASQELIRLGASLDLSNANEKSLSQHVDYCLKPIKRTFTTGVISKKKRVKTCKWKQFSPNHLSGAVATNNLLTLTPPNSDQSTIYSTTPSPNNVSTGVKNLTALQSAPSTSSALTNTACFNMQQQNFENSLYYYSNQNPIVFESATVSTLGSISMNYYQNCNDYNVNRQNNTLSNSTPNVWSTDFYSPQHNYDMTCTNHLSSPSSISGQTPPLKDTLCHFSPGCKTNFDGIVASTSSAIMPSTVHDGVTHHSTINSITVNNGFCQNYESYNHHQFQQQSIRKDACSFAQQENAMNYANNMPYINQHFYFQHYCDITQNQVNNQSINQTLLQPQHKQHNLLPMEEQEAYNMHPQQLHLHQQLI